MVCFDESPEQLIAEVRPPLSAEPGQPARYDVEYKRNGGRNLLMMCEPKRGVREVRVTKTRNRIDFAQAMKHLVELYAGAEVMRVALEFHYTPRHDSWLNLAEIECAVLSNMCLKQRIGKEEDLKRIIAANVAERNRLAQPVKWCFSTADAHQKLQRLYPAIQPD